MFDLTSSKLFLLAIVALLVIGPKDFPVLLRTLGKYMGIIRGHAKEFRAQFDEAMRESELSQLKKDVENIAQEAEASFDATGRSVEQTLTDARQSVEASVTNPLEPVVDPLTPPDAAPQPQTDPVPPAATTTAEAPAPAPSEGMAPEPVTPEPVPASEPAAQPAPAAAPAVERTGA
jgi:sec-independent protein translocase protein TatB